MAWANGSANIYNAYQDLRLLESKPKETELNINLEKTNKNTNFNNLNKPAQSPTQGDVPVIKITDVEGQEKQLNDNKTRNRRSSSAGTFNIKPLPSVQNPYIVQEVKPYITNNKSLPRDKANLSLVFSPNKDFFITITTTSVELWINKPTILVAQMLRTTDSIVTQGGNVDISFKKDSKSFCVFTSRGYIYFYDIIQKVNTKNTKHTVEDLHLLNNSLSSQLNGFGTNNPNNCWIRNPAKYFDLKINLIIFVEAGIRSFMCLDNEIMVSTQKNPSLCAYGWKEKVLLSSFHLAHDAPFLKDPNVMINQLAYDYHQKLFILLTSDGSIYLAKRKVQLAVFGTGSPYEWSGIPCHICDGSPETYTTFISVNQNFYLLAAAMKNNQIFIYSYGKNGNSIKLSYKLNVNSQITCISWSNDRQTLAVGTSTKGLIIYNIFDTSPNFVTLNGKLGFGESMLNKVDDDPYATCIHWACWNTNDHELFIICNSEESYKGKIFSLKFDKLASIAYHTDDNIKNPFLFSSNQISTDFFEQTDQGSINPDAIAHISQIPYIYALDNFPIKYVSSNKDGSYIAIAGQRGLAHYSLISRKWKWFNHHNQEQNFACFGGIVWYKQSLIVGCKLLDQDKFMLKCFPREKNLDFVHVTFSLEIHDKPKYLNIVNNWLLVYTNDNILNFYEVLADSSGRVINIIPVHKISLEGVVKAPDAVKAISWFPGNIKGGFPRMLVLVAGTLLLFTPEMHDGNNQPRYKISSIADKVLQFQLLDMPLAGVHFTLWAYSQGEVKLWYHLPEVPYFYDASIEEDEEEETKTLEPEAPDQFRFTLCFKVPFFPVTLDLKQGLLFGIEQSMNESLSMPGIQFWPSFKSHIVFYQLLDELITQNLDQEAYLFALNFEPYPYFGFGLEILLHDVLVRESEGKDRVVLVNDDETLSPDAATLPKVVNLIKQFPHFAQVVVSCARKIEMALWDHLFATVGSPNLLFEHCISTNQLKTAASYLIILHTMEEEQVSFDASSKLLRLILRDRNLELFHEVAKFMARIHGTNNKAFLQKYLVQSEVMNDPVESPLPLSPDQLSE